MNKSRIIFQVNLRTFIFEEISLVMRDIVDNFVKQKVTVFHPPPPPLVDMAKSTLTATTFEVLKQS
jgi:hypothetical protein